MPKICKASETSRTWIYILEREMKWNVWLSWPRSLTSNFILPLLYIRRRQHSRRSVEKWYTFIRDKWLKGVYCYSSPDLKTEMRFSDHLLSVRLTVRLFVNVLHFRLLTQEPLSQFQPYVAQNCKNKLTISANLYALNHWADFNQS